MFKFVTSLNKEQGLLHRGASFSIEVSRKLDDKLDNDLFEIGYFETESVRVMVPKGLNWVIAKEMYQLLVFKGFNLCKEVKRSNEWY